jgi:hypothetical protein
MKAGAGKKPRSKYGRSTQERTAWSTVSRQHGILEKFRNGFWVLVRLILEVRQAHFLKAGQNDQVGPVAVSED